MNKSSFQLPLTSQLFQVGVANLLLRAGRESAARDQDELVRDDGHAEHSTKINHIRSLLFPTTGFRNKMQFTGFLFPKI